MARRRKRARNIEPVSTAAVAIPLVTAAVGGIATLVGSIWGASEQKEALEKAAKQERLRLIEAQKQQQLVAEQAAQAALQNQAYAAAEQARRTQSVVVGGVAVVGLAVAGFFLWNAVKSRRRR